MSENIVERLHVVVGVLIKEDTVCIAKRSDSVHLGGLWEFPGGKVEKNEMAMQALIRELNEEIGIMVESAQPLIQLPYDYPERQVLLDFWQVIQYSGEPQGCEGQAVIWAKIADLPKYNFPDANHKIVNWLLSGLLT